MSKWLSTILNWLLRARKATKRKLGIGIYTLFTDVSEFQRSIYTNSYPCHFASFRSNDGTYRDRKFAGNLAWAKAAADSGRISGFIVYFVWRPNWQETVNTLKAMVGTPHPKMAVMIDVESWGGQIHGNQSLGINAARESLISWLHGNRKRVIGYANAGDFANLWPSRGDAKIILANYSSNPAFPGKIAHQYTSSANVAPFGRPVDLNSADGLSPAGLALALGLTITPPPAPKPPPVHHVVLHRAWPSYMHLSSDVFGPITGPVHVHGGYTTAEKIDVKAIQVRLQQLKCAPITSGWADGVWGDPTTVAMRKWQATHHQAQTGVCNHTTWNLIFTY